jgi:enoyl-CoA hydratase
MGLGIITAAGGSQTLPRTVSRAHALDMLLTGRWIKADEALRLKLVNQVVPRSDLLPAAERLASKIKAYDPKAISYAKQAVTRGLDLNLEQGLELEANLGSQLLRLYRR